MKLIIQSVAVIAVGGLLAGCSTPGVKNVMCIAAGTLVGGAAARYGTDDSDPATAAGAIAGGLVGALLCKEPEKPTPPPAPKPMPKPTPKPIPQDPDTDGDGVRDSQDDCPKTTKGTPVDQRGCPEIPNLEGVHFEFNKAKLTSEATMIVDEAVRTLSRNPHVRVEIVGHTDSVGSDAYNLKLSEKRANAVRNYLTASGIDSVRISVEWQGESMPIANNSTREGRQANRRVELTARPQQ